MSHQRRERAALAPWMRDHAARSWMDDPFFGATGDSSPTLKRPTSRPRFLARRDISSEVPAVLSAASRVAEALDATALMLLLMSFAVTVCSSTAAAIVPLRTPIPSSFPV